MTLKLACLPLVAALLASGADAATLRVATQSDATSMDPHSLNETSQLSLTGNVYEPLVGRDRQLGLAPALAIKWTQTSPTVWRFELRRGVKFHDGTPMTADDVVFSFKRAAGEGSDMRSALTPMKEIRKAGDFAVEIETAAPYPILPDVITQVYVLSKKWCEDNKATAPVDRRKGIENAASFRSNGTGPYRLRERQPALRSVFTRNELYWARAEGNVDEVVFTPIASDGTRVAALLSGEVDLIEPVPLQDIDRLRANGVKVLQGPELRTIFLGMDQHRDELLFSSVKGKNPFKDKRVRQAVYQAIDIETIKSRVMRGAATPTGVLMAPGVKGFAPELNKRLPYDPEASKKLLAEAGYPSGFEVAMNCPNDRYVNDSAICLAVAANLARVGIRLNLQTESKATYFPKIISRNTSMYLLGWTPATYDAHNVLAGLVSTQDDKGAGQGNHGRYSNAKTDELIQKIQTETDQAKRNELIRQAFKVVVDEVGYIPLHQQALAWGMNKKLELTQPADNFMPFKWMTLAK
jgi:peptide/nickel transport system substrate-binding protein